MIFLETSTGNQLTVAPEHLFLLSSGKLQRADALQLTDLLLLNDDQPVRIVRLEAAPRGRPPGWR